MDKKMKTWFFMRPGFDTFLLEPEIHSRYLFGTRDRRQRDHMLTSLEEAAYSNDGYKATVFGDYGRGKTHQCHNIIFEIERRSLPFVPVYVKCGAFKKKDPFNMLFRELVGRHSSAELRKVATEYQRLVNEDEAKPLKDIIRSEDIAKVLSEGLTAVNIEAVKTSMRWLGGDDKVNLTMLGEGLKPQLVDIGDFGAVMRGLAEMFIRIQEKVPLYIVDEAERFQNITDTDTYFGWLAALRELTEIHNVAMIFMIAAKTRDYLPNIFVQDEIIRRIGVANYIEFLNPGRDDLHGFLLEQFQTTIRKGELPKEQHDVVIPEALDDSVPDELNDIIGGNEERLRTYPFDPDAFDHFVGQIASGEMSNKPSEAQIRVQKAAQRAMRQDMKTISLAIVENLVAEAF